MGTALPQLVADQLGWHDFAGQVEAAWNRIPVSERPITAIKVDNYGEAAALDPCTARGCPPRSAAITNISYGAARAAADQPVVRPGEARRHVPLLRRGCTPGDDLVALCDVL